MLELRTDCTGLTWLASPLLEQLGVFHAFSTRLGGISDGPFASLNMGNPGQSAVQDSDANIAENYRRLLGATGLVGRSLCRVHQTHSDRVLVILPGQPHDNARQADALVTADPATTVSIRTADCVPLLVSSSDGRWVAAVHAGWRGVVAGILPTTLGRLIEESSRPAADFTLAIGPCIGPDAFEVGPEVVIEFEQAFGDDAPISRRCGSKAHIDLPAALCIQALRAGLPSGQIDQTDLCTYRQRDLFFSHRRDNGLTGRMATVISPRPM